MAKIGSIEQQIVDALVEIKDCKDKNKLGILGVAGILHKHCGDNLGKMTLSSTKKVKAVPPEKLN